MELKRGRIARMEGKLGGIVSTLSRGAKRVRDHPAVAAFSFTGLLVLVLNPFNWVGWPDLLLMADRGMTLLLGAQWSTSPTFRIACLLIVLGMLGWVGKQAERGDRATALAWAKHNQAVAEQNEAVAATIAAHRDKEMAKWDRIVGLYFRQKRVDDATAAMGRLRAAIEAYPAQVDGVKKYHSNYDFGVRPWENLGRSARDEIRNVAMLLGVEEPEVTFSEPAPPLHRLEGGTMDTLFDEENAADFFAAHAANESRLTSAADSLDQHLRKEALTLVAECNQLPQSLN
jgi:hypothetical protein